MKGRKKTVVGYTASACAVLMLSSVTALAAPSTGRDIDIENSVWSYRVVADVQTQVNIRAYGSIDSAVIGYLPKGASADLIEKGEEWSHVLSGGLEGYIKNEYLAFGADAEKLASVYGTPGVRTSWDGVHLFEEPSAAASIVDTVEGGSEFDLLEDQGLWYLVQTEYGGTAYIPAEDTEKTIITERAISLLPVLEQEENTYSGTAEAGNDTMPADNTEEQSEGAASAGWTDGQDLGGNGTEEQTVSGGTDWAAPESQETEETVAAADGNDLNLLAAIIYCEAGNQSREGKVAVGAVVLNRVASSSFPDTISEVIYQSGQFTPAYSGGLASALANGVPGDCVEAAQAALNGENPVGQALYFNTGSGRGMKIGAHQFY